MELTSKNIGKKIVYNYFFYGKNGYESKQQIGTIKSLLIDVNNGAYGYEINWDDSNCRIGCNFINKYLPFTKNLIGENLNELILKN